MIPIPAPKTYGFWGPRGSILPFSIIATYVAYEDLKLLLLSFIMQFSMFFSRLNQPKYLLVCGGLKWTRTTQQFAILAWCRLRSPDSFAHWFAASLYPPLAALQRQTLALLRALPYGLFSFSLPLRDWWAQVDSNHRPRAYQARALTG